MLELLVMQHCSSFNEIIDNTSLDTASILWNPNFICKVKVEHQRLAFKL